MAADDVLVDDRVAPRRVPREDRLERQVQDDRHGRHAGGARRLEQRRGEPTASTFVASTTVSRPVARRARQVPMQPGERGRVADWFASSPDTISR